ncbi:hypothetical protein AB1P65_09510 [Roseibium alexandrii]
MVSSPTSSLKLAKQATGDNLNTHGVVLNEQVIDLIDEAVAHQVTISLTGNHTLTSTNYVTNEARQAYLIFTDGGLSGVPTVTAPSDEKWWWIKNSGSTYAITFGVSGGTSVSIPAGKTIAVFSNGTDCELMDLSNLGGSLPLASIDGGTDISTVAGIAADVTAVAAVDTEVTTVAGIDSDVTTVAGISANVTTVAAVDTEVTTVAGISANVTTVAGDSADIQALAAISADVSAAAAIDTDITTVSGVSANVTTVATNITDVTTCATNIADIQDAANLFGDVVQGPGSSTDNYVPRWDGTGGDTLKAGLAVGTSANNLVQLDGSSKLPAVDGSQLTGIETGGMTQIGQTTISSAVASVEFTSISSDYDHLLVVYDSVSHNHGGTATMQINISGDNGSTYLAVNISNSGSALATFDGAVLIPGYNENAGVFFPGVEPSTTDPQAIFASGNPYAWVINGGIDAVRVKASTSTLDAGTITLYGY